VIVSPRVHNTKVNILFVTSMHPTARFPKRGVVVLRLASALRERGHRVDVFELGDRGGPWRYLAARSAVTEEVRRIGADIVHVHFGYSGLAVPSLDVPVVTSFNGDDLNGTWKRSGGLTLKSRLGILVSQVVAFRSRSCIAVSTALRARLWTKSLRRKTVVIRDAVDPRMFVPQPQRQARERLGVSMDERLVLFPHDASQPTKRLWLAEEAVDALRGSVPAARLWIVNDKPPDEMPRYYAAADALIVTSAREGGPSSAKEALACGLPVVSVAAGDTDLFTEVPDATFLSADTPEALASALLRAFAVSAEPRRCRLPSHLMLPDAAERIEQVYRLAVTHA
jgi:glycosyltransferase involved in cell wall biosynthesis